MSDTITVTGLVASVPRHTTTKDGVRIVSMRLASQQSEHGAAVGINWYTLFVLGDAAPGVAGGLRKGDRVVVSGMLRIREWGDDVHSGVSVELTAQAIGVDLVAQAIAPA